MINLNVLIIFQEESKEIKDHAWAEKPEFKKIDAEQIVISKFSLKLF